MIISLFISFSTAIPWSCFSFFFFWIYFMIMFTLYCNSSKLLRSSRSRKSFSKFMISLLCISKIFLLASIWADNIYTYFSGLFFKVNDLNCCSVSGYPRILSVRSLSSSTSIFFMAIIYFLKTSVVLFSYVFV